MKTGTSKSISARRFIRNAAKSIYYIAPLKQVLFEKINRHERSAPIIKEKSAESADAGYSSQFTSLTKYYYSRHLI